MPDEKTKPFQMRVSPEWLTTLDDWRRAQNDLPSRAEAIRRLVENGLSHPMPTRDAKSKADQVRDKILSPIKRPSSHDD